MQQQIQVQSAEKQEQQTQMNATHNYIAESTNNNNNNNNNNNIEGNAISVAGPPMTNLIPEITETIAQLSKCARVNCNNNALINPEWEDAYCSNECVVLDCRDVFNTWVQGRKLE